MMSGLLSLSFSCNCASLGSAGWSTSIPRELASRFTGESAGSRPRPAGRSGLVSTPLTRWRDSKSASRHRAANSGVPAKTIFTGATPIADQAKRFALRVITNRKSRLSGCLAQSFLKFRLDALLLEARKIVHEDFALEVIHFVLDADREQLLGGEREGPPRHAERVHRHALGALNGFVDSWNRETSFLAILDTFSCNDLRVDQHQQLVAGLRSVDHDYPFVHVDLRRREPDPGRSVHRFRHVAHQSANRLIDLHHPGGPLVEPRIRVAEDIQQCHKYLQIERISGRI